ncbi:unnamed protein product [Rotaria magnacalcarata]
MYGYFEAKATNLALKAIRQKRAFILSRSSFAGSGQYTAHWTGDNGATYEDMYFSIADSFSSDSKTLGIDRQFLIGRAILVSPNLDSTATTVHVYIPDDVWYQFPLGVKVKHAGVFTDLDVLLEKINAHIPGSFIIPMKIPGTNLIAGRGNPFTSPVA